MSRARQFFIEFEFWSASDQLYWFPLCLRAENQSRAETLAARIKAGLQANYQVLRESRLTPVVAGLNCDTIAEYRKSRSIGKPVVFNINFSIKDGPLKGLAFGAGTVYGGRSLLVIAGTTAPARYIPACQTYDGLISYDWKKKLRLQLNLRNLTDRHYYPTGNTNSLAVGEARTIGLTTTYRF
ncbi:MAG: hypothetical protein ACREH8_20015 [Opitutaceae bacterium]